MFSITTIESGSFLADGGAMFGAIPKRAWMRKYPELEDNLCKMSMRCVLAVSEDRKILIDLGMGDKYLDKVAYYKPFDLKDILVELSKYNISATEITDVVLSHLHFDHCGYATRKNGDGDIVPSFPNAKYWLSKAQWDNFQNPSLLESDSMFADDILPIEEANQLHFVENDMELCEGFRFCLYNGHTVGQLVVLMTTQTGIVAYPGDLIPTSAHVSLEWISAYDLSAQISVDEKRRFLVEAVEGDYTLIYYHDAYTLISKVKKLNDNFKASDLP